MVPFALAVVGYLRAFFVPRHILALEAAALRQQLAVFKRKQTRPNCTASIGCSGLLCAGYGLVGRRL
jgi:hypothetical protein